MADNEALTFEKVWAMFQETRQAIQENAEQMKETDRRMKETDRIIKENAEQMAEQMKETDRIMKETNKVVGDLGKRFGQMVEHMVIPNIKEKFKALNVHFDNTYQNLEITTQGKSLAEIDILLENGDTIMAVEVKSKPNQEDVKEHAGRMEVLRKKIDAQGDSRKLQGAIAGAIMSDGVRNYAHKTGFYVIEQTGDTVKINIPEGFKPREW